MTRSSYDKWIKQESLSHNFQNCLQQAVQDLDEKSRVGISCVAIAESGNVESGIFLLDTDGDGKNAPFKVKLFL